MNVITCNISRLGYASLIFNIPFSLSIGMVDTIFADVAQPDQARIVAINAHHFLKNAGHIVISIKVMITAGRLALFL